MSSGVKKSGSARLLDASIVVVLIVLAAVVLLPMFWMILTAFKVKGTAFQLAFLPETEIVYPQEGSDPFTAPSVSPDDWYIHLELDDPNATTAFVRMEVIESEETIEYPMTRYPGGVWSVTAGPLPDEAVTYQLVINDQEETISPAVREGRTFAPNAGVVFPRDLSQPQAMVYYDEAAGALQVSLTGDAQSEYRLDFASGPAMPLTQSQPGGEEGEAFYTAGQSPATSGEFRIVQTRSLGRAIAAKYTVENFTAILASEDFNFASFFVNSLVVAGGAGFLTVFICTLAAYAFSTKKFHYREPLFAFFLASMLVPGMIYMVPQFSITLQLGLMNTYAGMIVPHLANVFGLFLMRQYIDQIPRDLFAAAQIDGAREHQVFSNVVIPVCLPIMVTLFLLVFVGQWSNFLWQLIVNTGTSDVLTLPVGLQQFKGQNANEWEKIMAGACFSIIPIAVLFLSLQRYFLEGLTAGSVKE